MSRGVLFLAAGDACVRKCKVAVAQLRRHDPAEPVAVATDYPAAFPGVTVVPLPRGPAGLATRVHKTRMYDLSPFAETLYLDADVIPLASVSRVWDHAGDAALAMVREVEYPTAGTFRHSPDWDGGSAPAADTPHFNAGVIAFRRTPAVAALMAAWHREWLPHGRRDQPPLCRALAEAGVAVRELPGACNDWATPGLDTVEAAVAAGVLMLHRISFPGDRNRYWRFAYQNGLCGTAAGG